MTAWLFLMLTLASAYLTYKTFRWRRSVRDGPFSAIAWMWGKAAWAISPRMNKIK